MEIAAQDHPVTPAGDPIMGAKFRAAAIKPVVLTRQRLLDRLSEAARGPLTLISAPAGSGKTVLASSWVLSGAAPGPVTWIALDEDDGRCGIFWSYVIEGLARSGLSVSAVGMPDREDQIDRSILVRLAACLSEQSEPVVLILDDAEELTRADICDQIDFVLRHSAGQLRLIIVTRIDPGLPLHRYRLEGAITEIRFPDLAFTLPEARDLLRAHNIHVSDPAVITLAHRTKGWAAGLRLVGMSLEGMQADAPADLSALAIHDLGAYFRTEVLAGQPEGVRDFLLRTSVVERIWPDLAVHLSGVSTAASTLRTLAHANTFVEKSKGDEESYQFPPLVRDLLQAQLQQEAPAKQRQLHRRAAVWLESTGRAADATRQYAAAGKWEAAASLLVRDLGVGRLLAGPPSKDLASVLGQLPEDTAGVDAAIVCAALALADHDRDACAAHLLRAEEAVGRDPGGASRGVRLAIAIIKAELTLAKGDPKGTLAAAGRARAVLSEMAADGQAPPSHTLPLVLWDEGAVFLGTGNLKAARDSLSAAVRAANLPGEEYLRARCLARLALAEALDGHLRRAVESAGRAVALGERSGTAAGGLPPATDVALAWVSMERGDTRQARAHVEAAEAMAELQHDPMCLGALALIQARLLRARGDLAGALAATARTRPARRRQPLSGWLVDRIRAVEAGILVAQGHGEIALRSLDDAIDKGSPGIGLARAGAVLSAGRFEEARRLVSQVLGNVALPLDLRVEGLLLTASAELEARRTDTAIAAIREALSLAEPEGMHRPFVETTARLRAFLRGHGDLASANGWRNPAPGSARTGDCHSREAADMITQPLTEREHEVLVHLAELLPTEEIASTMFVSVNTVKTHVRAILRKLSAERRNEAVRRARELGLI